MKSGILNLDQTAPSVVVIRASEVKYLNKEIENICNIESTHQNIHEYIALDISFNLCNLRSLKMQH